MEIMVNLFCVNSWMNDCALPVVKLLRGEMEMTNIQKNVSLIIQSVLTKTGIW